MKEFYANKGTAIECDDFSPFIDFNGDGVIDENDKEGDYYSFTGSSLFDKISTNADCSTFTQILVRSGYDKILSSYGAMTVFVPNNKGLGLSDVESATIETCQEIAKRYILSEAITVSQFANEGRTISNLLGETVSVTIENETYKISISADKENVHETISATITDADVECFNGYMNLLENMSIDAVPQDVVIEESYWNTKEDIKAVLAGCYLKSLQFEESQLKLEGLRTENKEKVHTITPQNGTISGAYTSAYSAINMTNLLITYAPSVAQKDASLSQTEMNAIMAEAKSLRAFTYYNLAMLWGDVCFVTEPMMDDTFDYPAQSKQADVLEFAYTEICEAIGMLPTYYSTDSETKARFTRNAGLMLKAELELTLGRYSDAKKTLDAVDNTISFSFATQESGSIPVYTSKHRTFYQKEANGNVSELENEWAAMSESRYGYWAALKRLGKAQEVTGCYDYELLMPFPYQELRVNPKMTQNPGY